jgi:hypothetical protein
MKTLLLVTMILAFSFALHAQELPLICSKNCDVQGMGINIITQKQEKVEHHIDPKGEECEIAGDSCKNGTVECEEEIQYVQFQMLKNVAPSAKENIERVNKEQRQIIEEHHCKSNSAIVRFTPRYIYAHYPLISIIYHNLDYCLGCGGSCHSHDVVYTYNIENTFDGPLTMESILRREDYRRLKIILLKKLKERLALTKEQEQLWDQIHQKQVSDSLDKDFWQNGFFLEKGKIMVNIDGYFKSCADGSFNPVEIPQEFLRSEFVEKLKQLH